MIIQYKSSMLKIEINYQPDMRSGLSQGGDGRRFIMTHTSAWGSQSTLWAQVRSLERTIEATLFGRIGRPVRITLTGQALMQAIVKLSAVFDDVAQVVPASKWNHEAICA